MQQNGVYDYLKMLELSLEEGFPIIPRKYTIVKTKEIETLIDKVYGALPVEVQESRALLKRRDEIQTEAQQRAEKIITDAQREADQKLSEANYIKAVEREANRIMTQVQEECEAIKKKAYDEAEAVRHQAYEEAETLRRQSFDNAKKTKDGAELYVEQVLTNLEDNLIQLQQVVKNGQIYMENLRASSDKEYEDLQNANYEVK